ncbi:MAG: hypothetical protein L0Z70_06685 [Chloroflexi bacterium]|nr:hypothetical protein [Chloroflexota bacterium]
MARFSYLLIPLLLFLAACTPAADAAPDLLEQAALEATAIIQSARATALVMQAQATADALVNPSAFPSATPLPTRVTAPAGQSPVATPTLLMMTEPITASLPITDTQAAGGTPSPANPEVTLLRVSFGNDGQLIHVQFLAPPEVARNWQQGMLYVIDEETGVQYANIPVAPVLGPLLSKPIRDGQPGYVMLINTNMSLGGNRYLTVILGDYRWEHVKIGHR